MGTRLLQALLLGTLSIGLTAGCSTSTVELEPPSPSEGVGAVYDTLSDDFTITTLPTEVVLDGDFLRLVFAVTVENKSNNEIRALNAQIVPSMALDQYLAAGALPSPPTDFDLAPANKLDLSDLEARGIEIFLGSALNEASYMKQTELSYLDIAEKAVEVSLTLDWEGGQEEHQIDIQLVDPNGLLKD